MIFRIILRFASFVSCIAGVVSYHPFFFPRYQPDNYGSVRKSQTSKTPFEYKRRGPSGFDRLSMGFIKRDNDETTDSNGKLFNNAMYDRLLGDVLDKITLENSPQYSKRYFDRLSSGFIRKKRSTAKDNSPSVINSMPTQHLNIQHNENIIKPMEHVNIGVNEDSDRNTTRQLQGDDSAGSDNNKRGFDRLNAGFVKRPFDRLNSGFVKRPFDRLSSGFVKRPFDRLTSGFVKRPSNSVIDEPDQMNADDKKRGFDRLNYGLVKRPFDRLNSGFVKKDDETLDNGDVINEKRYFDRLNMGFIKRNGILAENDAASRVDDKRGFDRLTSSFVKKKEMLEDKEDVSGLKMENKRYFDRLTNGFVKKNDNSNIERDEHDTDMNKRRFDRISNGFVKRPQENTNSSDDH
ncbi:uncharacterized protein LOC127835428 [Dreissena polymorpha]|uniref:Uncharacterized protein n=1 Tax=Dreissena polymorpha TaxID=45954 RepID=A0A9D4G0R6_DREPO|nr:uncharacterized protein LOC127835428 [Dreissena polymorpha]KAH3806999.1 hypothetical protein DPMN_135330 [Dreissena polymorpha]